MDIDASRLLYPLNEFYSVGGRPLPDVEALKPEDVPDPYRSLLLHSDGMSARLASFHGERIVRNTLQVRSTGETYSRRLRLTLESSARPAAYAAVRIYLSLFSPSVRDQIVAGKRSLGAILKMYGIVCADRSVAPFRVLSDDAINDALGLSDTQELYGRAIRLHDRARRTLAEAVEILAP
jgi:chorismate-pyruvate lyase